MKKREFLTRGGAAASAVMSSPWLGSAAQAAHAANTAKALPHTQSLDAWQTRLGTCFEAQTPLGRVVSLRLAEVTDQGADQGKVEQFSLSFEGPRHLPLSEGTHTLHSQHGETFSLHLQPLRAETGLRYQAHFSLLA